MLVAAADQNGLLGAVRIQMKPNAHRAVDVPLTGMMPRRRPGLRETRRARSLMHRTLLTAATLACTRCSGNRATNA